MDEGIPALPFPTLLKQYRRAAGLTQAALAERAGYSTIYLSKLEEGERRPLPHTVAGLATALGLAEPERAALEAAARRQGTARPSAGGGRASPAPGSGVLPLVGRWAEQELLSRHLAGTGPPILLLAGEPGIGKSRLLGEATRLAAERGWTVLEGGCQRRSGQEPFAPLMGALEGHLRRTPLARLRTALDGCAWLVRLLPELAETPSVPAPSWTLPPEQERRLMFAAVGRYLTNVAGPAGALLVLDDLQWASTDALDLLVSLMYSPAAVPLRVLGAYRTTDVRPPEPLWVTLADLASAGLAAQHRLGPLAPQEASILLQHVLAGKQDLGRERREQLLARSGGVPFFLVSCAEALGSGTLASEEEAVPWTVAQSIRQRVATLPKAAQALLGVAAVIGRQMKRALLVAACTSSGQDERALMGALEDVGQAHLLLETDEDCYQFPHDLIREVVLADLSALRRRHAHAQIAAALEQTPGELPVEQLAYHYRQTDDHEKAILYLERAGDRARTRYAHSEAETAYRALLAQVERLDRPGESARVCRKLSRVLRVQARDDEALALLEQAAEHYRLAGDPAGQWRTLAQIGYEHFFLGTPQAGLARLEPWLARVKHAGLPEVQVIFQSHLSGLYLYNQRFQEALAQSEEALAIARGLGQARRVRLATLMQAQALMALGQVEAGIQALEPLLPAQEAILDEELLTTMLVLSLAYDRRGDFPRSDAALKRGLEAAERMGYLMWSAPFQAYRGNQAFLRGDWRQARQDCEQALEKSRHSRRSYARVIALFGLGQFGLAEGQREDALRQFQKATAPREGWPHLSMPRQLESVLAEDDLLHGQPAAAHARLEAAISRFGDQPSLYDAEFLPLLGWAALEAGEKERAEALIAAGIELARNSPHRLALVDALRIQALLRIRQQHWAEAEAALEEALLLCRAMPYPWAEAKALYVCGLLHQAKGEQEAACKRLEAALAICARLGERLYAEQMEQALAALNRE